MFTNEVKVYDGLLELSRMLRNRGAVSVVGPRSRVRHLPLEGQRVP